MNFSAETIAAALRFLAACHGGNPEHSQDDIDREWRAAWWDGEAAGLDTLELDRLGRIVIETAPYSVGRARYSRGNYLVRCGGGDGRWKTRAMRLLGDGLKARWTGRENGYVVSPAKLARFRYMYAEGWDASAITGRLIPPPDNSPTTKGGQS